MLNGISGKLAKAVASIFSPAARFILPTINKKGKLNSLKKGIEWLANDDLKFLTEAAGSFVRSRT